MEAHDLFMAMLNVSYITPHMLLGRKKNMPITGGPVLGLVFYLSDQM